MFRGELAVSDGEIIEYVQQGYGLHIHSLRFIDSGSFFGFIVNLAHDHKLFLKIYTKLHITDLAFPSKLLLNQIGEALHRLRNEFGMQTLSYCIPANNGQFCFETKDLLLVLFEYLEGAHPPYEPNILSADKLALIFYQLHHVPTKAFPDFKQEDFNIDYALGLRSWVNQEKIPKNKAYAEIMLSKLEKNKDKLLNNLSKLEKEQARNLLNIKDHVITHGDAHHYNVLQTNSDLWLVDWDGLKIAPRERDLWHYQHAALMQDYCKLDPDFTINHDLCAFYQLQRIFEDLRFYLEQVLLKCNLTVDQDEKDIKSYLEHWGWRVCLGLG